MFMLTVDGGKLNMARVLSRSNRPIIIQEPQSGLDTFLTEIAKYASPEYQQQRRANERADARLELDRQEINTARQRYANQQEEKARAITLEQTRYDEGKRIEDKERKYVATERLKKEITSELDSVPISSFQGDGYSDTWNSVSRSMLPNESEDEFGLIDLGSNFAKNIYNKKKIVSDNAYAQAEIYKPLFPELTLNQLAKSMVSGDSIDLISDKIDKQGKFDDVQKDKLKGFNSSIKENLGIISTAQETLNELDPEDDKALYNSVSSSINTYRNDINALNKQIESIYSSVGQAGFTVPGDNQDFSGANLNLDDEDSSTVPMYLMDNESFAQLEDEESIFESEEQEKQRLNSSITNLLAIENESQNNDIVYSDRLDETAPPATEKEGLDLVESREDGEKLGVPEDILNSLFPPSTKAQTTPQVSKEQKGILDLFDEDLKKAKRPNVIPPSSESDIEEDVTVKPFDTSLEDFSNLRKANPPTLSDLKSLDVKDSQGNNLNLDSAGQLNKQLSSLYKSITGKQINKVETQKANKAKDFIKILATGSQLKGTDTKTKNIRALVKNFLKRKGTNMDKFSKFLNRRYGI